MALVVSVTAGMSSRATRPPSSSPTAAAGTLSISSLAQFSRACCAGDMPSAASRAARPLLAAASAITLTANPPPRAGRRRTRARAGPAAVRPRTGRPAAPRPRVPGRRPPPRRAARGHTRRASRSHHCDTPAAAQPGGQDPLGWPGRRSARRRSVPWEGGDGRGDPHRDVTPSTGPGRSRRRWPGWRAGSSGSRCLDHRDPAASAAVSARSPGIAPRVRRAGDELPKPGGKSAAALLRRRRPI